MNRKFLFLFTVVILVYGCKPKDTPAPQKPSSQNDTLSTDSTSNDTIATGFNENVLPWNEHNGTISKSIQSHDGNILVLGKNNGGAPAIWKLNIDDGNVMWMKEITDGDYVFTGITEKDNNDIVVSGYQDSLLIKAYNSTADVLQWRTSYLKYISEGESQVISLANNNLLLYERSRTAHTSLGKKVLKVLMNENGQVISSALRSNPYEWCSDIIRKANDQVVVVYNSGPDAFKVNLLAADGSDIVLHYMPMSGTVNCNAVKEAPNGDLICCVDYIQNGPGWAAVARLSPQLDDMSYQEYNGIGFGNVIATQDGFIAVGGKFGTSGIYAMRRDNLDTLIWERICSPGTTGVSPSNIFKNGPYYVMVGSKGSDKFFLLGIDEDGKVHP